MKKTEPRYFAGALAAAALAAALAFAACSTEIERPYDKPEYTLPAPAYVTARAYGPTGVIRVAWAPVANASGYDVYRKSVSSSAGTTVKVMFYNAFDPDMATYLGFDDVISYGNEFNADTEYSYKVVARVNVFDSTGFGTGDNAWQPSNTDRWALLNYGSRESAAVKFSGLLGAGEQLAAPTGLQLVQGVTYSGDTNDYLNKAETVHAQWDAQWGLTYIVAYGVGGSGYAGEYPMLVQTVSNNPTADQRTAAATLPLIFGDMRVEVIATQRGAPNPPVLPGQRSGKRRSDY